MRGNTVLQSYTVLDYIGFYPLWNVRKGKLWIGEYWVEPPWRVERRASGETRWHTVLWIGNDEVIRTERPQVPKSNAFSVTIPAHLQTKFSKLMETMGLDRQELVLHLISDASVGNVRNTEPSTSKNIDTTNIDWNATEPHYFGPSNFGFHCAFHKTRHEAGTVMVYAGPENDRGNRKTICDEAAEELKLDV